MRIRTKCRGLTRGSGHRQVWTGHGLSLNNDALAETLIQQGLEAPPQVHVLERLSLLDQRMTRFDLASLAASDLDFSDLSIVVIPASSVERPT